MEQGIDLAGEVIGVLVGNELFSFHPEPSLIVVGTRIVVEFKFTGFCETAPAYPRRFLRRGLLVNTRQEVSCEDNGFDEMIFFLGIYVVHCA